MVNTGRLHEKTQGADADEQVVVRLLRGAAQHSTRRVHEMGAATRMLASLGVPHTMTLATTAALAETERTGPPPLP
ncbi:DUF1932 domain-containing protein [Nonomuraea sp. NPDC049419]|uniref:DUF1932 domain-containing protein n=1 Tax=Nonomuraea sp. NPDC049419 TaxID=3155772 RepID=UPI00341F3D74